jgi:hypothetical protein
MVKKSLDILVNMWYLKFVSLSVGDIFFIPEVKNTLLVYSLSIF